MITEDCLSKDNLVARSFTLSLMGWSIKWQLKVMRTEITKLRS